MRTIYVYCKKCNVQVAGPLVEIQEESLRLGDRQDALEIGQFSLFTDTPVAPQLIISLKEGELANHPDKKRFQGCCGSDGTNGLNKLCSNGHDIATEFSDCYIPHYIASDTEKITVKEKMSDHDFRTILILKYQAGRVGCFCITLLQDALPERVSGVPVQPGLEVSGRFSKKRPPWDLWVVGSSPTHILGM